MNRKLNIALIVVIALSLIASGIAFFLLPSGAGDPGVTVVEAPEQTKAQRPACFPDPEANYIPMPETENLAVGKPISSGEHTDVYVAANVNDGKTDTYWESVPAARYDFNPDTGNRIRIDFDAAETRFVKLIFTMNSSSRTGGAQAAEIEIYE